MHEIIWPENFRFGSMENCNKPDPRPDPGNEKEAAFSQSSSGNKQNKILVRVVNHATSIQELCKDNIFTAYQE